MPKRANPKATSLAPVVRRNIPTKTSTKTSANTAANKSPASVPTLSRAALNHRPLTLAGLRGFEAAARHGSLTRAAFALNLTQSAVSRQVQGLEEEFGVTLFVRKAREIVLTDEGKRFLRTVQRLLAELDSEVERMRRDAFSPRISVSTFASFASLWLIPRLSGFRSLNPAIDIDIGATDRLLDLDIENIDVAIRYLRHDIAPEGAQLLLDELLFPIIGPGYAATAPPLRDLHDLAKHTLIESTPGGPGETLATWGAFFEALGIDNVRGRSQLKFDFIAQSLLAAQRGQGVALSRIYGADMAMNGELVRPFDVTVRTGSGCFLVVSARGARRPEVQAFVQWLRQEISEFNDVHSHWLNASAKSVASAKGAIQNPSPVKQTKARKQARSS